MGGEPLGVLTWAQAGENVRTNPAHSRPVSAQGTQPPSPQAPGPVASQLFRTLVGEAPHPEA